MKPSCALITTCSLLLVAILVVGCGSDSGVAVRTTPADPSDTSLAQFESSPVPRDTPGAITANGIVVPAKQVSLSFPVSGQVEKVTVGIGGLVEVGQVLARLDKTPLERAVARADADLTLAQAQLTQLRAAPDEEAVAAAESGVVAAEADLASAQAGLTAAQNSLAQAERRLAKAEEAYTEAWDAARDWELHVKWRAERLEAEREGTESALKEAQEDLRVAQADYSATQVHVQAAQAQVEQTKVHRDAVLAGTAKEEIAAAQVRVDQAQLALEQAQADLAGADLAAPFAGTVTAVMIHEGEIASARQAVLDLADTSYWRVETNNIGELQVGSVKIGQEARVTVNAFLGKELVGTVVVISPTAIVQHGDTTYTITIELEETDLGLRWGMTAKVRILAKDSD